MSYDIDYLIKLADNFEKLATKQKQFVYHIKNPNFQGKYIQPLSKLKDLYPKIYKKELNKYEGREAHLKIKIPLLDVCWEDCVNFSTLNPLKIFQLEMLLGVPGYKNVKDIDIFRFNIKDLKDTNMCLYDDNKSPKKPDAYKKVTINNYKETQFIPEKTAKYFIKSKEDNEYPLIFGNVTHLLVNDAVPIDKADIINFNTNIFE